MGFIYFLNLTGCNNDNSSGDYDPSIEGKLQSDVDADGSYELYTPFEQVRVDAPVNSNEPDGKVSLKQTSIDSVEPFGAPISDAFTLTCKNSSSKNVNISNNPLLIKMAIPEGAEAENLYVGFKSLDSSDWNFVKLNSRSTDVSSYISGNTAYISTYKQNMTFALFDSSLIKEKSDILDGILNVVASATVVNQTPSNADLNIDVTFNAKTSSSIFSNKASDIELIFGGSSSKLNIECKDTTISYSQPSDEVDGQGKFIHRIKISDITSDKMKISGKKATYSFVLTSKDNIFNILPQDLKIKGSVKTTAPDVVFSDYCKFQRPSLTSIPVEPVFDPENVNPDKGLVISFAEEIEWTKDSAKSIVIRDSKNNVIPCKFTYKNKQLTIEPEEKLQGNSEYTITVSDGLKGKNGLPVNIGTIKFTTEFTGELITLNVPCKDKTDVQIDSALTIEFSKEIAWNDDCKKYVKICAYGENDRIEAKYTYKSKVLTIKPYVDLSPNARHYVEVLSGIPALDKNDRVASGTFNFVTDSGKEPEPDELTFTSVPAHNATGVDINAEIKITFDSELDDSNYKSNIKFGTGTSRDDMDEVAVGLTLIDSGKTVSIKPVNPLQKNKQYGVLLLQGITSKDGKKKIKDAYKIIAFKTSSDAPVSSDAVLTVKPESLLNGKLSVRPIFEVDFGKTVKDTTLAQKGVKVMQGSTQVTYVPEWNASSRVMTISFPSNLAFNKTYTFSMDDGILDNEDVKINKFETVSYDVVTWNGDGTEANPYVLENSLFTTAIKDDVIALIAPMCVNPAMAKQILGDIDVQKNVQFITEPDMGWTNISFTATDSETLVAEIPSDAFWPRNTSVKVTVKLTAKVSGEIKYFTTETRTFKTEDLKDFIIGDGISTPFACYAVEHLPMIETKGFDKKYKMERPLTITSSIGSLEKPFTGTFDGNKNPISLTLNNDSSDYVALFPYTKGANVVNVLIDNTSVISGKDYVGSVIGKAENTLIGACTSRATVTGNGQYTGGLIGYGLSSIIDQYKDSNSGFHGTVIGGPDSQGYIGGFAGALVGSSASAKSRIHYTMRAYCDVISNNTSLNANGVGGVVGYCENAEIDGCRRLQLPSIVNAENCDCVGLLIGKANSNVKITDCIVKGKLRGHDYVGGLVGYFGDNSVISETNIEVNIPNEFVANANYGAIFGYTGLNVVLGSSGSKIKLGPNSKYQAILAGQMADPSITIYSRVLTEAEAGE